MKSLEKLRVDYAGRIRELRKARGWTQAALSKRLGISQARLSELERGAGSFTAEQFLTMLALFNVGVDHFVPDASNDADAQLQNALARLGAMHLRESSDVVPSDHLRSVVQVTRQTLQRPRLSRWITALAPVLVTNADDVPLSAIHAELASGMEHRLGWVAENTLDAVRSELRTPLSRPWVRGYRRAETQLASYVIWAERLRDAKPDIPADILDAELRSSASVESVSAERSTISARWRVVSSLLPKDFAAALRAARDSR